MSADTSLRDRIHDELIDSVDEELELEIDDHRLSALLEESGDALHGMDRKSYFEELLRLQKELVKLQGKGIISMSEQRKRGKSRGGQGDRALARMIWGSGGMTWLPGTANRAPR